MTNRVTQQYVHPDFETDKSDTGYGVSKPPSESNSSSLIVIPPKDENDPSIEVFRADQFHSNQAPTEEESERTHIINTNPKKKQ